MLRLATLSPLFLALTVAACSDGNGPSPDQGTDQDQGIDQDQGTDQGTDPCAPPDVNANGEPAYPFGTDADDDGDGHTTYLLGGDDTNDADAAVYLSVAQRTFTSGMTYDTASPTSEAPTDAAFADVDHDGLWDLLVTDQNGTVDETGAVEVWLGDGDGTFNYVANYPSGGGGRIAMGDVNGDGFLDALNDGRRLSGSCTGEFTLAAGSPAMGYRPNVVDWDGDDDLDVVGPLYGSGVGIDLSDGAGAFTSSSNTVTDLSDAVVGYLDSDARLDVVTTSYGTPYTARTFLRTVAGGLSETDSDATDYHTNPALADVNEDGFLDVITNDFIAHDVSVLLGDGDGHIGAPSPVITDIDGAERIHVVDMDGDGHLDLTVSSQVLGVAVAYGVGNGTFATPVYLGTSAMSHAVVDVNGDGRLDIVSVDISADTFRVFLAD